MKKYRLIEYKFDSQKTLGDFSTFEDAALSMRDNTKDLCSYRIDEVEESVISRVGSYEDACEVLGITPINFRNISWGCATYNTDKSAHIIALLKLENITAALNEGWKPDWEDKCQEKWYVVSYGNSNDDCIIGCRRGVSITPSRLVFKSSELAEYAAKQFAALYKQLLIEKF